MRALMHRGENPTVVAAKAFRAAHRPQQEKRQQITLRKRAAAGTKAYLTSAIATPIGLGKRSIGGNTHRLAPRNLKTSRRKGRGKKENNEPILHRQYELRQPPVLTAPIYRRCYTRNRSVWPPIRTPTKKAARPWPEVAEENWHVRSQAIGRTGARTESGNGRTAACSAGGQSCRTESGLSRTVRPTVRGSACSHPYSLVR